MTGSGRLKSIVLLSGGLDSTVAFKKAVDDTDVILALTFDYGQRAAVREIAAAAAIAGRFDIEHKAVMLPWLKEITKTALVAKREKLPVLKPGELDSEIKTVESAKSVWVPNRNGIFINIAAAYCESMGAELIVAGFNAEEAITFPDNSSDFVDAINGSLGYSTLSYVKLISPTLRLDKRDVARLGVEIGAPLELLWSCYEGGDRMCGRCESCLRLKRGLAEVDSDLIDRLFC